MLGFKLLACICASTCSGCLHVRISYLIYFIHITTDALQQGASQFEQQAGKLKRKFWWKNLKMMIVMGVIGLIILIIIIGKLLVLSP